MKKEYAITITYKCNWNCIYCAVNNSIDYKPYLTHNDVLEKIKLIENNSIVTIFGGEPGIVDKNYIQQYIKLLFDKKCVLKLETNGLFIRRYPELLNNFNKIIYHCSENLEETLPIKLVNHELVEYMIIVHDNNIQNLERFLTLNSHIKFYLVEATYPHDNMNGPTLSKKNKYYILTHFNKHLTRESIFRLINGKNFDSIIFLT